jgi:hypothetical protein
MHTRDCLNLPDYLRQLSSEVRRPRAGPSCPPRRRYWYAPVGMLAGQTSGLNALDLAHLFLFSHPSVQPTTSSPRPPSPALLLPCRAWHSAVLHPPWTFCPVPVHLQWGQGGAHHCTLHPSTHPPPLSSPPLLCPVLLCAPSDLWPPLRDVHSTLGEPFDETCHQAWPPDKLALYHHTLILCACACVPPIPDITLQRSLSSNSRLGWTELA